MKEKTISIVNQIEQIEELARVLETLSDEWSLPTDLMLSMNLVLEELISNIIFYGYEDKSEHKIIIRFLLEGGIFQMQIEDDAVEFNPLQAAEPDIDEPIEKRKIGGLGIHFVRKLTDKVIYERTDNKNILTLTKSIM